MCLIEMMITLVLNTLLFIIMERKRHNDTNMTNIVITITNFFILQNELYHVYWVGSCASAREKKYFAGKKISRSIFGRHLTKLMLVYMIIIIIRPVYSLQRCRGDEICVCVFVLRFYMQMMTNTGYRPLHEQNKHEQLIQRNLFN